MLGGQVVVTVISALFLRRLPLTFSQKWLFSGVYCYGCPTDQELRAVAGDKIIEQGSNGQSSSSSSSNVKGSRKRQNRKMSQESTKSSGATYAVQLFSFPKSNCVSVPLQLQSVLDSDVINWKFWIELKWLLDYMTVTCFAILCSNLYAYTFPKKAQKEFNLTIVWLIIGWMFTAHALLKLVVAFFKPGANKVTSATRDIGDVQNGEEGPGMLNSHEAFICLCSASLMFLFTCFGIILMPPAWLDFEFKTGCQSLVDGLDMFFSNLSSLNNNSTITSSSGANENHEETHSKVSRCKNASVLFVGLYAAVMGLVLTFPSIRLARIHLQMTSRKVENPLHQCTKVNVLHRTLSHLNLLLPLSLCALGLKPFGWRNFQLILQMPFLSVIKYDAFFLWNFFLCTAVLFTAIIKLSTVPVYLRVYLASLREKTNNLITQAGNISNVQYQKIVASHNYYACVVCVQLMAPAALLFFQLVLMAYSVSESSTSSGSLSQGPAGAESPAYSPPSFKLMWKLIPTVLCLNLLKATIFVFFVIHTLFSSIGLLLNFSNQ